MCVGRRILDFGSGPGVDNILLFQNADTAADLGVDIRGVGAFDVVDYFKGNEGKFFHAVVTIADDGTYTAYADNVVRVLRAYVRLHPLLP